MFIAENEIAKVTNYEEFKALFKIFFDRMMSYSNKEVGSVTYAEYMGIMTDKFPKFEAKFWSESGK